MKHIVYIILSIIVIGCQEKNQKKPALNTEKQIEIVENKKTFPKLEPNRYNVAFLIMDGTYNTEFTAPFDIFQHTQYRKNIKQMNVFTVANTDAPITTFEGVRIIPDYNYLKDALPKIDILVVPSAEHHLDTDLEDTAMIDFVKKVDQTAIYMTSHCDGAFVLAKAGILNDVVSTTFPSDIDKMRNMFPDLDIRKDVLFVHDGKYITSAGGAKSFEAALYLCEYLYGVEIAKSLAGGLVIDWKLDQVPHLVISK
ncbi:DJ-1/PfpI family protein [uncultured Aquimarina sp.]|uniref:DJ-1/PfpI family protein n=1 Tax=uncultured Aquimarina sp. TaxID=575652 RepID=UPI00261E2410|nr:DJ-1/PfpI family protein [uncultured Aquimarina sp.]